MVGVGRVGLGGYQPGIYVPLKALFLVISTQEAVFIEFYLQGR